VKERGTVGSIVIVAAAVQAFLLRLRARIVDTAGSLSLLSVLSVLDLCLGLRSLWHRGMLGASSLVCSKPRSLRPSLAGIDIGNSCRSSVVWKRQ
jgi:hypothetical protein